MSKLNKRGGFTLAELLIVVAIIAILIAIAIPVFGGQLDNAKIQTDHANMRSAYALAQTGSIQGGVFIGADGQTWKDYDATKEYFFQADGSITEDKGSNPYALKASVTDTDKCKESAVCNIAENVSKHKKDSNIVIKANTNQDGYTVELRAGTT